MKHHSLPILLLPVLPICVLLNSCASEDMAMLGAFTAASASNYAANTGDLATAANLASARDELLQDATGSSTGAAGGTANSSNPASAGTPTYPIPNKIPGKEGFVSSPYTDKMVNVTGIPGGTLVQDPTYTGTGKGYFRVPGNSEVLSPARTSAASDTGIVGTWSNTSGTWNLSPNGTGTVTIPTVNHNGTATTYLNWKADASSHNFAYTITRATLTGSLNCDGTFDYDKPVNKSYAEPYQLSGSTLTIGTEVLRRN